jgi:ubiquinone/menaquinone biosynthesis C-methylase UbiE
MPLSTVIRPADSELASGPGAPDTRKARFWDRIARKYAADPIADLAGYELTLQRVQGLLTMERVKGLLTMEQNVLEIGCGTGSTALRLAPFTGRLLAIDVSSAMIAIAREKLAARPLPQLSFAVADADAPMARPGEYDAVLAFNLLHLVTDLDHVLALAAQALRPGGLLISKTACVSEMNPLIRWLAIPLMRAIGKAPHVLCFDAEALQAAMVRQGLEIEAVERHGTKGKDIRVFIVARKPG